MTPPESPAPAEMQKLLRDLEHGLMCGYCPMKDCKHGQFCPMNSVFAYVRQLEKDRTMYMDGYHKLADKPQRSIPICPECKYECDLWYKERTDQEGITCRKCRSSFDLVSADWTYCDPDVFGFLHDRDEKLKIAVEALEKIEALTQYDADQIDNWQVRKPANEALSRIRSLHSA
jgi:hypothetical protein